MPHPLRPFANVARRLTILIGLDRLIARTKHPLLMSLRPDIDLYARPTMRRVRRDGIQYELDLSDYMQWTVYFDAEREGRDSLYALVEPGQVVLDVGTNIGETLLNFARLTGSSGRVIGFEPHPATCTRARANLALNGFTNVQVEQLGVGRERGILHLGRRSASNTGADTVMLQGPGTVEIPVTTIDGFCVESGIDGVDLVKIDVEGSELNVLRGAVEILTRDRPTLFIEVCDDNLRAQGDSAAALIAYLDEAGYTLTAAGDERPITPATNLTGCFLDIIAVPKCRSGVRAGSVAAESTPA